MKTEINKIISHAATERLEFYKTGPFSATKSLNCAWLIISLCFPYSLHQMDLA